MTCTLFNAPFDVVKSRFQSQLPTAAGRKYRNTAQALLTIYRHAMADVLPFRDVAGNMNITPVRDAAVMGKVQAFMLPQRSPSTCTRHTLAAPFPAPGSVGLLHRCAKG